MLRRWDDSQRFLADMPQLISEETANFLILWCIKLQREGVCSRLLSSPSSVFFLLNPQSFLVSVFAERGFDEAGGPPGCGHAVHPGAGFPFQAGPTRLLPTVLLQSQSKTQTRNKYLFISCKWCTSTALYIRKVLQFNKYLSLYEIKTHLKVVRVRVRVSPKSKSQT